MDVDTVGEAYTPHGSGAHPLAAQAGLGRSPLTLGGVGHDLYSPVSVLLAQSGLRLTLPKGARRWRGRGTRLRSPLTSFAAPPRR